MAPVADFEGEKVGPPTEDIIQALMETLVDPLLPLSVSAVPPEEDEHKSVAKQMHAVVLLYNYHCRKRNPDLKFLDLVSFSKLAVSLKPPLVSYMKLATESQPTKSNISNDHLSITEKAIKDACDIALSLDSSEKIPNIEGWPISKVAVLLIDPKKENCMLRFGDVTNGVWSLIEKELSNESIEINADEVLLEETIGDKRKRNSLSTNDNELLQFGYDAVKDVTGIGSSELKVLGTHVTYSLSKDKSAVRFYMMQCPQSFSVKEAVSLKFLAESLQGPLSEKLDNGIWGTTYVVEFYHMLPYVDFISCWLSGKDLRSPIIKGRVSQSTTDSCIKDVTQTTKPDLAAPKEKDHSNSSHNSIIGIEVNSAGETSTENSEKARSLVKYEISDTVCSEKELICSDKKDAAANLGDAMEESGECCEIQYKDMNECDKDVLLFSGHSEELTGEKELICSDKKDDAANLGDAMEETGECCEIQYKDMDECDKDVLLFSGHSKELTGEKELICSDKKDDAANLGDAMEETGECCEIQYKDMDECDKDVLLFSGHSKELTEKNMESENTSKKVSSELKVYQLKRRKKLPEQEAHVLEDGGDLRVNMEVLLKSHHVECIDETMLSEVKEEIGTAAKENQVIQTEDKTKSNLDLQNLSASEEVQNALSLIYEKREKLYSQFCNMDDTLASYESDIARIRDGKEVGLARKYIESILSWNHHSMSEHGIKNGDCGKPQCDQKKTKLSEIYLPGKSSCEDLEYTCLKNNWRLPRYLTEPSDGKFVSCVFVGGKEFELHLKGGLESKPCEARESAAAQIMAKLRSL